MTVQINCSSDLKIFENSWPSASNFKSFFQLLEQFFSQMVRKIWEQNTIVQYGIGEQTIAARKILIGNVSWTTKKKREREKEKKMQNASQKMHFFHSYLLTKKDEGDSQMKRMKRKCRARLDFHFIKTKDQFVCHKLYIKAVEGVGKLYNYLHGLVIFR